MKTMMLSHKIQLSPTCKQAVYLGKACGIARFAYNWGLSQWREQYQRGERPSGLSLKKQFNALKQTEFPWVYEVTKYACQQPFIYLQKAFNHFFQRRASYPQFKKRGVHDSFYIGNDHIQVRGKRLRLPKLGWIKMREELRFRGKVMSATVCRVADKWFVSLQVQIHNQPPSSENQARVGVDLGISTLATLFDGKQERQISGPKPLKQQLEKLRKAQRRLSRMQKGSKNRAKQRIKVARLHYSIRNIRQDSLHKLTSDLASSYKTIVIEDLNVKGMMSNHHLARSISDMGFYEFRRQLMYKAELQGCHIEVADRWFPSTKQCSQCLVMNQGMTLSDRLFICSDCGFECSRDGNAARNLRNNTVSSTGIDACGEEGSGLDKSLSETSFVEARTKPCTDLYTF